VHALNIRDQWNSYPNSKRVVEDYIRENQLGKILRLGVIETAIVRRLNGAVPVTTDGMLINCLNNLSSYLKDDELDLVSIQQGGLTGVAGKVFRGVNALARKAFPATKMIQIFFEAPVKLLGFAHYGYTADMMDYYQQNLLVGFGALGSRAWNMSAYSGVMVSDLPDARMNKEGFNSTLVGRGRRGLGKYWHGAYIVESNGKVVKRVMPIVRRSRPPVTALHGYVTSLEFKPEFTKIFFTNQAGQKRELRAAKLTLACGALENTRLLNQIAGQEISLSDHEIFFAGSISRKDAVTAGLVQLYAGMLASRDSVIRSNEEGIDMLIDVRPYVDARFNGDAEFYNNDTLAILGKVIRSQSFARINEAIFNKFGVGLGTSKYSVFVQVLVQDCISVDADCQLKRRRLGDQELQRIGRTLQAKFPSFLPNSRVRTLDAQHIMGGEALVQHPEVRNLLQKKQLSILGSPTAMSLDYRHHTKRLIDDIPNHVM
jgi:hypothetical protein